MKNKITRYVPLGIALKPELGFIGAGMGGSLVYSLSFVVRYLNARITLYEWRKGEGGKMIKQLSAGAVMPDFAGILEDALYGFGILSLCMLLVALYHYFYHYQESKSVYLMRRLPDRWEWHRRCLTLPAAVMVLCLLTALLLLLIFFGIYMIGTPQECLTPGQWAKLWQRGV